jgi:hypothetical protein
VEGDVQHAPKYTKKIIPGLETIIGVLKRRIILLTGFINNFEIPNIE